MRYVKVPEPVFILNPITDEPVIENGAPVKFSFARSVRLILSVLSAKGASDTMTLLDIRSKFDRAAVGEVVELSNDEYGVLAPEFKRPTAGTVTAMWLFSSEPHQRAVLDASDKLPNVMT